MPFFRFLMHTPFASHRSMFHLRDDALVGTFGLAEQVKAAGITSVEMGLLTTVTNGRVSSWVPR